MAEHDEGLIIQGPDGTHLPSEIDPDINRITTPSFERGVGDWEVSGGPLAAGGVISQQPGGSDRSHYAHLETTGNNQGIGIDVAPTDENYLRMKVRREFIAYQYVARLQFLGNLGIFLPLGATNGLTDISGKGRNGTAVGGATIGGIPGPLAVNDGGATDFDGTDDRITTSYSTRLNYCPNPVAAVDTGSVVGSFTGGLTATALTRVPCTWNARQPYCFRMTGANPDTTIRSLRLFGQDTNVMPALPGQIWSASARFHSVDPSSSTTPARGFRVTVEYRNASNTLISAEYQDTIPDEGVSDLLIDTTTNPAPAGTAFVSMYPVCYVDTVDTVTYEVTELLLEPGPVAGPFFHGGGYINSSGAWVLDPGRHVAWFGTANASVSGKGCFIKADRTFTAWASRDSLAKSGYIVGSSGATDSFRIGTSAANDDHLQVVLNSASGTSLVNATNALTGIGTHEWFLVAVTISAAGEVKIYVNGVLKTTSTPADPNYSPAVGNFQIGSRASTTGPWDGGIDLPAVTEGALTANQIKELYYAGRPELVVSRNNVEVDRFIVGFNWTEIDMPFPTGSSFLNIRSEAAYDFDIEWSHLTEGQDWFNGDTLGCTWAGTPGESESIAATGINLNVDGGVWSLEALDFGNPPRRDELVQSTDSDGAVPPRVAPRDLRDVTARLRLINANDVDDAIAEIGKLEAYLNEAEKVAAKGGLDPVADFVKFLYRPHGAKSRFALSLATAEIVDAPKVIAGDDAGWFIDFPVINIQAKASPFGYGEIRRYLETTTAGGELVATRTIDGGPGEVPPHLITTIEDTASKVRGRLTAGIKRGEVVTPTVPASTFDYTGLWGILSSGIMVCTSDRWVTAAKLPRQTKTGKFRLYLSNCFTMGGGEVRIHWAEAGGSRRKTETVVLPSFGVSDLQVAEINAQSDWDAWIEVNGDVRCGAAVTFPVDSFLEAVGPMAGEQLTGPMKCAHDFNYTEASLNADVMMLGPGAWATSTTWPVSATYNAIRTTLSMGSPAWASAGSAVLTDTALTGRLYLDPASSMGYYQYSSPCAGFIVRFVDSNNYLVAGFAINGGKDFRPGLWAKIAGTFYLIEMGPPVSVALPSVLSISFLDVELQVTADGRWWMRFRMINAFTDKLEWEWTNSGAHGALISGEVLGSGKIGLHDHVSGSTPGITRRWFNIWGYDLAAVTPPPIPADGEAHLKGPILLAEEGAKYPYLGASGFTIDPGVDNTLAIMARRSAGAHRDTSKSNTDPLKITIDGYPRFITVPHS